MGATVEFRLPASPGPGQVTAVCARLRRQLVDGDVRHVVCDAEQLVDDLQAVEALARVALTARRSGSSVHVRGAGPGLRSLLELVGLDEVLSAPPRDAPQVAAPKPCPADAAVRTVSGAPHRSSKRRTP